MAEIGKGSKLTVRASNTKKVHKSVWRSIFLWLFTWPKITFVAVNVALVILIYTVDVLEVQFFCSKLLGFTFFGFLAAGSIYYEVKEYQRKKENQKKRKHPKRTIINRGVIVISTIGLIFISLVFGPSLLDVFRDPVYISGKVLDIREHNRGPTMVQIEGDNRLHEEYYSDIPVEIGSTYRFRLMPASGDIIALEKLD